MGSVQDGIHGQSVRRFFQYLILFGLMVVIAIGLSGLLSRLFDRSTIVFIDQTAMARNVSFIVVGIPLFVIISLWTRKQFVADHREAKSFAWGMYFTLACVTSLSVAMISFHELLTWGIDNGNYSSGPIAQFIVWGGIWGAHWWLDSRFTPAKNSRLHHIAGSLIGLGTIVVGLSNLLSGVLERLFRLGGDALFVSHTDPIVRGAITLLVGVPVWILYWIRTSSRTMKDSVWSAYVLLAGVAGGLLMSIIAASTFLYTVLVWFFGEPSASEASIYFRNAPTAAAFACVGGITWWYHKAVIQQEQKAIRTEVQRIYEYVMAGIGLLATAGGIAIVIIAVVEALTGSNVIVGTGSGNTLLAAATLLIVGSPVWWIYWRRIQAFVLNYPEEEHTSPARKVYLFLVFGVGGLAAIITLLVGVFFLFDDIFKGNFGSETIHRMRFPIGLLLSTGAVAGYHWSIYRNEREYLADTVRAPRFVLLIGPRNPEIARDVAHSTGAKVQSWARKDVGDVEWSAESVIKVLKGNQEESVVVISDSGILTVISVDRG
jgi:hypothetical protein